MAIKKFETPGQILNTLSLTPQDLIYNKIFSKTATPTIGSALFSNKTLSTKLDPASFYGIVVSGQLYEIKVDASSNIKTMNLIGSDVNPAIDAHHIQPAQDVLHDANANVSAIRSAWEITQVAAQTLLNDTNWATGFDAGATRRVYLSTESAATAAARTLVNLDITALAGFDIAPLTIYEGQKYSQTYIHIAEVAAKNRRILIEGNLTYYWMPPSHKFDNSLFPSFYKYFPDIELPAGKIAAHQWRWEDDHPLHRSNTKGFTSTPSNPYQKSDWVDYDSWMLNSGMPVAYSGTNEARQAKWDSISEDTLKAAFKSSVVDAHAGRAYVELNFEPAVGLNVDDQKMQNVLEQWKAANPKALLAFWAGGKGAVVCNRIQFEANADASLTTPDLKFTGTYQDWLVNRAPTSLFGGNYYIYTHYADIFYCTDLYQSRPNNTGFVHHALCMTIMNKKFFPDKKCIWIDFHAMEYQLTGPVDFFEVKDTVRGTVTKYPSKPIVSPGQIWTRTLFAVGFADGIRYWDAPFESVLDPYWYGSPHGQLDQNDDAYTVARYKTYTDGRNPGRYLSEGRSMKSIDRHVAALWAIAENKDIIESSTTWSFIDFSVDGGVTYNTADDTLPSETFINQHPVVMFKKNNAGTVGLLLFYNPFQDPTLEVSYKVKINAVAKDIKQIGDYASCIRISI